MSVTALPPVIYDARVEKALDNIAELLRGQYRLSKRAIGVLLLQGDCEVHELVADADPQEYEQIQQVVADTQLEFGRPLSYVLGMTRQRAAARILERSVQYPSAARLSSSEKLSRAMITPWTGIPILALVLFFGLYQFVGVLGAQVMVGFLENTVFEGIINPWIDGALRFLIPFEPIRDLFGGKYGIFTFGVRYAFALILPIVGTFFIAFSIIEDTGYLPRLAMLVDRVFKLIGLNGRAVIPMVLGFGCDTMATIVTRTLETTRERVIATMLLALAIPCSAQLGVIFAILSGHPAALAVWVLAVGSIFMLVGFLAARLMPGERPNFYMELPPLRWPRLSNVLVKTYTRMEWYFLEVFPVFILASVIIWVGQLTGLFDLLIGALTPVILGLGLPADAAAAFLFGFFRRDFGAAGLFDLAQEGAMNGNQLAVAAVTLTLFVPCVAQFSVMLKERGVKTALGIVAFIFPFAFGVGFAVNAALTLLGVSL